MEFVVQIAGVRQRVRAEEKEEETPWGVIKVLQLERSIPLAEMQRLANEQSKAVRYGEVLVFPRGKSPRDLAQG